MAYQFEGAQVNITNLASGNEAKEPTAVQYHTNRINCIYRKASLLYIQYSDDRGLTWSSASQIIDDINAREPCICRNYYDGWALAWNAYTDEGSYEGEDWEIKFCQALPSISVVKDIISANVDKGIDMIANGARVTISNRNFEFDFQRADSLWEKRIIPGSKIELFMGLGENLDKRFCGYIDNVKYDDNQTQISISARGMAGVAIDKKIGEKKVYGTDKNYKQVFIDLLTSCGFSSDEYYIEDISVNLAEEKVFNREDTYMSAIQKVCDDIGWIIWEDEDGKIFIGSPSNYPVVVWNYFLNVNCFSLSRNIDKTGIPYKVVVTNEELGIEKEAIVENHGWITVDQNIIEYFTTEEDDPSNIQQAANDIASDLSLKIFTIDIMVPLNFYIQVRDRVKIFQTEISPVVTNEGIVIKVSESVGQDGMFSRLTVAVVQ